jgi:hypothetical protein
MMMNKSKEEKKMHKLIYHVSGYSSDDSIDEDFNSLDQANVVYERFLSDYGDDKGLEVGIYKFDNDEMIESVRFFASKSTKSSIKKSISKNIKDVNKLNIKEIKTEQK